jgi:anti-sigma factor RsiW
MKQCNEIQSLMTFYLDDELQTSERATLETHLRGCEACGRLFDSERRFLNVIRGSRPLHIARPELRASVEHRLSDTLSPHTASPELRHRTRRALFGGAASALVHPRRVVAAAAMAGVALLIGFWGITEYRKQQLNPPSEFALMAVDTHQRHQRNQLPLEIVSDVPERISAWFLGKVPFSLKLPNYQESSGQEKLYNLEGARLVGYRNDYAAYVAYKMRMQPISLVVTSEAVAQPSGGEEIVSKGLTFHYDSIQGLKVITWSDRGLTYALVSDLEERGQQSCLVCHQGTRDQDFIENLKPKQVSGRLIVPLRARDATQ